MSKTLNSGRLIRRCFSLYPHQLRGLAERSKAANESVNTLVRDALNTYLGIPDAAPDRVKRGYRGKLPPIRKSDPRAAPLIPMPDPGIYAPGLTPEAEVANPPPGAPPTRRLRVKLRTTKHRGAPAIESYTIRADDSAGLKRDLVIPMARIRTFWKLLPDDGVGPVGKWEDTQAMLRDLGPRAQLTPLEAYELYSCLEWDTALRNTLEEE